MRLLGVFRVRVGVFTDVLFDGRYRIDNGMHSHSSNLLEYGVPIVIYSSRSIVLYVCRDVVYCTSRR